MSLADDLNNLNMISAPCAVGRALQQMDQVEQESLNLALTNRDISAARIAFVLQNYGYEMSGKTVERHRNRGTDKGKCSCP